jgi:hypothetical protein
VAEELVLDLARALLQGAFEELAVEVQMPALDATAGEDAFGELVARQPQPIEHLLLRERGVGVGDREAGDPSAGAAAGRLGVADSLWRGG